MSLPEPSEPPGGMRSDQWLDMHLGTALWCREVRGTADDRRVFGWPSYMIEA